MNIIWKLFVVFFKIGMFGVGGGYAIIPMINEQIVVNRHWLTSQEFSDIITISQMTPGPLTVNTSTFVGMRVAGIMGALSATLGCIFMGIIIAYGIYHIFLKFAQTQVFTAILLGLKAGSLGLIASAAMIMLMLAFFGKQSVSFAYFNVQAMLIFFIVIIVSRKCKSNPLFLMLLSGILGIVFYL